MTKSSIVKWIHIVRPGTLAAGASPVFIGLMVAAENGSFDWLIALITFVAAIAIQIASNLINDYYDFKKGLDKAGRLGPSRAIAEGEVSAKTMKIAIFIDISIAVLCGIYLTLVGGLPILMIGCISLLCAWLYTATPYSLSYLGIADLFVLAFFGPVATVGTAYLQMEQFSEKAFWLGMVCGLISMGILTINNIRDIDSDRQAGKKSMTVRLGKHFGEYEYLILFLLIIPCLYMAGKEQFTYLVVAMGIWLFIRLRHTEGKAYNQLLIRTGQANLLFVGLYFIEYMLR
jgi:1,4-dihydroxy-2-naphthoate octaprenyltransferase